MQSGPSKPCKYCGASTHYPWKCPEGPVRKGKPGTQGNPYKYSSFKRGKSKHEILWSATRKQWFKENPAERYTCYLRISPACPGTMTKADTTLDHVKSRGRHPELRYVLSNLMPACLACNLSKGSRDLAELNLPGRSDT